VTRRGWAWSSVVALFLLLTAILGAALVPTPTFAQTGGGTTIINDVDDEDDDDDRGGAGRRGDRNNDLDDREQNNVGRNVINIILDDVQSPDVDNTRDVDTGATNSNSQTVGGETVAVGDSDNDQTVTVTPSQVAEVAQDLNISPEIVQQCIQQNAGRDANINSRNNDENINEEFDDEEFDDEEFDDEEFDDEEFVLDDDDDELVIDERDGEVLADTIPNRLLPNTGGSLGVWAGIVVLVGLYVVLLVWRVRRRGW